MRRYIMSLLIFCLSFSTKAQEPKFKMGFFGNGKYAPMINSAYSNYKTKYFVQKKDGSGITITSKIYVTENGRYYLTDDKKDSDTSARIYAEATNKITFEDRRIQKIIEGTSLDGAWLFKVVEGKINLYSCYPPPDYISNECLSAFQLGNGDIEAIDIEKLKAIMKDDKKAVEALDKKDCIKAIKKFNKG